MEPKVRVRGRWRFRGKDCIAQRIQFRLKSVVSSRSAVVEGYAFGYDAHRYAVRKDGYTGNFSRSRFPANVTSALALHVDIAETCTIKAIKGLGLVPSQFEPTLAVNDMKIIANSALMAYLRLVTNNGQTRRLLDTITKRSRAPIGLSEGFSAACALMHEDESEEGADCMSAGI
jgi:hypothetical protein